MDQSEIAQLENHYERCKELAAEWGLTPYNIDFHVVPADKMYEIASYGVPGHFSHWTYGRDFWIQKTNYDYGRSKIYELVINADPSQAFLLETNSLLENMFVISHVMGHVHFFANSVYFADTNRHIEQSLTASAERFREYEIQYGRYEVEDFIDKVLSIKYHVDPHFRIAKKSNKYVTSYPEHAYLDLFPEDEQAIRDAQAEEEMERLIKFPTEPDHNLLKFIADHGRLADWERDVMNCIYDEAMYFLPQLQTKIMNEGFASLIHRRMMHEIDPDIDAGGVSFSTIHSGVLSGYPGSINPYWLGYNVFQRIIERWDNPSDEDRSMLGMEGDEGWQKVLEAVELDNDESFLRNYLDQKVCEDLDLFSYNFDSSDKKWKITEKEWEYVRDALVLSKSNMGIPSIVVEDGDYKSLGQLYLRHEYDGRELKRKYADYTLMSIRSLWGRPVWLETTVDGSTVKLYVEHDQVEVIA